MIAFLNGRFVPEERAAVSVLDRGFLYGDGLFETMRVYAGKPFLWEKHMERLQRGADFLQIKFHYSPGELRRAADELTRRNCMREALLRLTLTRGIGPRGYSPRGADQPTLVMTMHPVAATNARRTPRWRLITASQRVPAGDALALHKTCNKLPHILARAEAEARGSDEALLLNTDGEVAEAASSNLFWIERGTVCTTPLAAGILAGVTRGLVLDLCNQLGIPRTEKPIKPARLAKMDGVFLTLSTLEIIPAFELDGHKLRQSPLVTKLRHAYRAATAKARTD